MLDSKATTTPDIFTGDEGETVFIRQDLAPSETAARAYALEHDGRNLAYYEADMVPMLLLPEHFVVDEDWWIVKPGTPNAVMFWRFRT